MIVGVGVKVSVSLAACSDVTFIPHVHLPVTGVKQHPRPNVKLPFVKQKWSLYKFLNNKRKVPCLFFTVLVDHLLGDVIIIMGLENRCLIFSSSSYSVEVAHDVSQHIKRVEDVNSNSSVKPGWLEQPQVLLIVHTVAELVLALHAFFSLYLQFLHFFINFINTLIKVFVNNF